MTEHEQTQARERIDQELEAAVRHVHRARWFTIGGVATVVVMALVVLTVLLVGALHRIEASCDVWADIGSAPLTITPQNPKPSQLTIKIIDDSREAFQVQVCPGVLPEPDPQLAHWERYYHLPVR